MLACSLMERLLGSIPVAYPFVLCCLVVPSADNPEKAASLGRAKAPTRISRCQAAEGQTHLLLLPSPTDPFHPPISSMVAKSAAKATKAKKEAPGTKAWSEVEVAALVAGIAKYGAGTFSR